MINKSTLCIFPLPDAESVVALDQLSKIALRYERLNDVQKLKRVTFPKNMSGRNSLEQNSGISPNHRIVKHYICCECKILISMIKNSWGQTFRPNINRPWKIMTDLKLATIGIRNRFKKSARKLKYFQLCNNATFRGYV